MADERSIGWQASSPQTGVFDRGSMLEVEFAEFSDHGKIREHNEDYLGHVVPATAGLVRSHGWLFALADGVGGQEKGEVASQAAVESILGGFRRAAAGEPHSNMLPRLVQQANAHVLETALAGGKTTAGMATTLVACSLRFDRAVVAHVGDSRCYLIRRGRATLLTRDHTVANEQVRLGLVSAQDAGQGSTHHILSRALGTEMVANVDSSDHQVYPGDVLLLCSDGLHGSVTGADMAGVVSHDVELNAAAQKLVALANERDGGDNISVQLIRVRQVERMGMYRGRPYKLP
jgi:serine/threonine protein phosphatase PrpC